MKCCPYCATMLDDEAPVSIKSPKLGSRDSGLDPEAEFPAAVSYPPPAAVGRLRRELTFAWVRDTPEWFQPIVWGLAISAVIAVLIVLVGSLLAGHF